MQIMQFEMNCFLQSSLGTISSLTAGLTLTALLSQLVADWFRFNTHHALLVLN